MVFSIPIRRLKLFAEDKFRLVVCAASLALAFFHSYQFVLSGFNYNCLVRLVFFFFVVPCTIFFGRKAVYIMLILFSIVASYLNTFNNYTGFFCLLMSCILVHRNKYILLCVYAVNETAALICQKCEISHIAIHLLSCCLWYVLYFYINHQKVALDLTDGEIRILDELIAGKQQKEIDFYNKNTVTKKLRNARNRNNCKTTNELLFKYRKSLDEDKFRE